jgi:hypothetical protein
MKSAILAIALVFSLLPTANAVEFREIQRVQVTHCVSDFEAPPVVVVSPQVDEFGSIIGPDLEIIGDPIDAEITCEFFDSAQLPGSEIAGSILTYGNPATGAMDAIDYRARLVYGRRAYSTADMTEVISYNSNGSKYEVLSWINESDGRPLRYDITFNRRAPDMKAVTVEDVEYFVPNYDAVTSITVEKRSGNDIVFFTLWFKAG